MADAKRATQPSSPDEEDPEIVIEETSSAEAALVVSPRHMEEYLPDLPRASAKELATPTGVSMLTVWLQEARKDVQVTKAELARLRHENETLRDEMARSQEQQRVQWVPLVVMTVGGALLGAPGWAIPLPFMGLSVAVGALLIFVGIRMVTAPRSKP